MHKNVVCENTRRVKRDFNKVADSYNDYAMVQKTICHNLCKMISYSCERHRKILDIGCGTGYVFDKFFANSITTQLDIAFKMCQVAYQNNANFTITTEMENLPMISNNFSLIISSMALHWASDIEQSLNEMHRVLEHEGMIYLSIPLYGTFAELDYVLTNSIGGKHVNDFMTHKMIKNIMHYVGFVDVKIIKQKITTVSQSFLGLLRNIKKTGSNFKGNTKLFGATGLRNAEKMYNERYKELNNVPLSWVIGYVSAKKC